jgi:putative hemolysin
VNLNKNEIAFLYCGKNKFDGDEMFLNKVKDTVGLNTFKKDRMKYSFDPKIFFSKPILPSNSFIILESENYSIKLAETKSELKQAQALRYSVFYKEKKAKPTFTKKIIKLDYDKIDKYADHLIVLDKKNTKNKIVGTYRLIRGDVAKLFGGYYSSSEFNLINISNNYKDKHILELGRSCIHQDYRNGSIMNLLWKAIAEYVKLYDIKILLGCASFSGTEPTKYSDELSYLRQNFCLPEHLSVESFDKNIYPVYKLKENNSNQLRIFAKLPPLLKGYLRIGGKVSHNFYVDHNFNTIDLCVVVNTSDIDEKYRKKYLN